MLFNLANLPYWMLLAIGVALFLLVIVSGGGEDDVDLDSDVDADITPLDLDTDANGEFSLAAIVGWLGFGKAPLLLLLATDLSLWGILGWLLTVLLGELQGQPPAGFLAGAVLGTSLVLALVGGSFLARPTGKALAAFGEDVSSDRLIGCLGTVSSARIPAIQEGKIGQVNALDSAKNRVIVNAVLPEWATVAPQLGDRVLLIDRHLQTYVVVLKDSPDQDTWFTTTRKQNPSETRPFP